MPTYEYACMDCAEDFEVQQSFTDASLTECPACEGRLRKVFNAVGIVFKGSGFYRTDSRATANGTSKANGSSESAKDAANDKAGSDAGKSGKSGGDGSSSSDTSQSADRTAKTTRSSAGSAA